MMMNYLSKVNLMFQTVVFKVHHFIMNTFAHAVMK